MIDLKKWLARNYSIKSFDDPDFEADKLIGRHNKVVASAKSVLRDHLQQQLQHVLKDFYSSDIPEEKNLIV
ncbi:MAG: hypothetical protein EOM80_03555 [Erysipelotrichia bacterium]|nr:hypothetical protein [Erysipelotrichia bacterium]